MTEPVDPRGDLEPWETFNLMEVEREWERQQAALRSRVDTADARYRALLARATVASVDRASPPIGVKGLGVIVVAGLFTFGLALVRRRRATHSTA